MNVSQLPKLEDFSHLKTHLAAEREIWLKQHGDKKAPRSLDDAESILGALEDIQTSLHEFFEAFPSLLPLFNQRWGAYTQFIKRRQMISVCFYEHHLFPDKKQGDFKGSGDDLLIALELIIDELEQWAASVKEAHLATQDHFENEEKSKTVTLELEIKELACICQDCLQVYRNKIRDLALTEAEGIVNKKALEVDQVAIEDELRISVIYQEMRDSFDLLVDKITPKLKRSGVGRLVDHVRHHIDKAFNFPGTAGKRYSEFLKPQFQNILRDEGLNDDLFNQGDWDKFFTMLGHLLWKSEQLLQKEFHKYLKSVLFFKRKDISAQILKEYLGEFWVYSQARSFKRKIIYHMGPTNSGKTYHAIEALCTSPKGCYLAPLRLLAAELFDTMNGKGVRTTLLTGEEVIELPDATHYSSTIEMCRLKDTFDCCVIDEIQMITDPQRGWAWTRALVHLMSPEIHVCGDPSVFDLVAQIVDLCGDEIEVRNYERMTQLVVDKKPIQIRELSRSDALIVFSRRNALKHKMMLEQIGLKVSIIYGRLSPEVRREQARKFDVGETDVIVSTDAISMGMNLPIKRIVFSTLTKIVDGKQFKISLSEIKQIAGRAGRFKRYPTGYVTCLPNVDNGLREIQIAIDTELKQKTKCMVGPDVDLFIQVNTALEKNNLPILKLSEFLRLFNTMEFKKPFFCVDLKEMIEVSEMVEGTDREGKLTSPETFGFTCAPVNLGLLEHVEFYQAILAHYVAGRAITNTPIDHSSDDIDYLETMIKCVELYQWLSRHFNRKNFQHIEEELLDNKKKAIEKLNDLLSEKMIPEQFRRPPRAQDNRDQRGRPQFRRNFKNERGGKNGPPGRSEGAASRTGGTKKGTQKSPTTTDEARPQRSGVTPAKPAGAGSSFLKPKAPFKRPSPSKTGDKSKWKRKVSPQE
jgi:ATP-dependent RNA helicase SUPV3L1/SUV3